MQVSPLSLSLPVTPNSSGKLDRPLISLPGPPEQLCGRRGRQAWTGAGFHPALGLVSPSGAPIFSRGNGQGTLSPKLLLPQIHF